MLKFAIKFAIVCAIISCSILGVRFAWNIGAEKEPVKEVIVIEPEPVQKATAEAVEKFGDAATAAMGKVGAATAKRIGEHKTTNKVPENIVVEIPKSTPKNIKDAHNQIDKAYEKARAKMEIAQADKRIEGKIKSEDLRKIMESIFTGDIEIDGEFITINDNNNFLVYLDKGDKGSQFHESKYEEKVIFSVHDVTIDSDENFAFAYDVGFSGKPRKITGNLIVKCPYIRGTIGGYRTCIEGKEPIESFWKHTSHAKSRKFKKEFEKYKTLLVAENEIKDIRKQTESLRDELELEMKKGMNAESVIVSGKMVSMKNVTFHKRTKNRGKPVQDNVIFNLDDVEINLFYYKEQERGIITCIKDSCIFSQENGIRRQLKCNKFDECMKNILVLKKTLKEYRESLEAEQMK